MTSKAMQADLENSCTDSFSELKKISGETLLLTGCAGFLGYYFSNLFAFWNANQNEKIFCTLQDNFQRGRPSWIDELPVSNTLKIEKHDVLDPYDQFDYQNVIHAASIASPFFYRKYPIETMDANVIGLRNLLDAQVEFRRSSSKNTRFLYFSTSEIYGDPSPENIPTKENYRGNVSCTGPRACYDESKRYGETLCVNFSKSKSLPVTIARPFNNYGPGLKLEDGRAISDFARSIKETNSITLLSDGSPTRTFCYISDAVTGYIKTLVSGRSGESYNIGSDKPEISILTLANMMKTICETQSDSNVTIKSRKSEDKDYLTDNPNRRCPDISKARADLGFNPSIELEVGLPKTLSWYGIT
jgi:nucleoside-diphosphate-sugar epimerase